MSREVKKDFKELLEFFDKFNLCDVLKDETLLDSLKPLHKKYFSYLTFMSEALHNQSPQNGTPISGTQQDYLLESCSDIGNSIFLTLNGAYKPSKMMLRSSIETFLKGFVFDEIPTIVTEKSVYEIFDQVRNCAFFSKETQLLSSFDILRNEYSQLCSDIHTATAGNMVHITALLYFPNFDKSEAIKIGSHFDKIVTNILILLGVKFNYLFHEMHHRNKEIVLNSIPRSHKPMING